jgi:deazaflavin-dependent oxidoreductase (nitroreductase family)
VIDRLRQWWLLLLKHTLNPLTSRAARAGGGPFALVRHVGRKSGRPYETPIIVAEVPGGFVAELTYGEHVDWYRNVVAAGRCELVVGGVPHEIVAIEPFPTDAGRRAFPFPARIALTLLRRHSFRFLRAAP